MEAEFSPPPGLIKISVTEQDQKRSRMTRLLFNIERLVYKLWQSYIGVGKRLELPCIVYLFNYLNELSKFTARILLNISQGFRVANYIQLMSINIITYK